MNYFLTKSKHFTCIFHPAWLYFNNSTHRFHAYLIREEIDIGFVWNEVKHQDVQRKRKQQFAKELKEIEPPIILINRRTKSTYRALFNQFQIMASEC